MHFFLYLFECISQSLGRFQKNSKLLSCLKELLKYKKKQCYGNSATLISFSYWFWFNLTLPALRSINGGSLRSSAKPRSSRGNCSRSRLICCPSSKSRTWIVAKQPINRAPNPNRTPIRTGSDPCRPLNRTQPNNRRVLTLHRQAPVKVTVWKKLQNPSYPTSKAPPPTLSQSER